MNLQNLDMKDYSATQNLILLTEIRKYQKQQLLEKKKENINAVIFNGAFLASFICAFIIFDNFFETRITLKQPLPDGISMFSSQRVAGHNGIKGNQNKKQEAVTWQI